jgi:hypothetical protein
MRLLVLVLALCAALAAPARATSCAWVVDSNISEPDLQHDIDSGSSYPSWWSWQFVLYADHVKIFGSMSASAYHCTTNLGAAASGNATFTIRRITACCRPVEDIEGEARAEFKAKAELDDDSFARGRGSMHYKASKMSLDCHAHGGVEATSSGYGDASSGTLTVPLYPQGPNTVIHWSKGGSVQQVFQDSDGGSGGSSPETIFCQTSVDTAVSVGWWDDDAVVLVNDSRMEVKVWGTCDGCCGIVTLVLHLTHGYQ